MLSVILMILKILGIVLLCIIGLILLVLVIVLAVPVRYRGHARKYESIDAEVHITWLLHFVHVIIGYDDSGTGTQVKLLGFKVFPKDSEKEKKSKKRKKPKKPKKLKNDNKDIIDKEEGKDRGSGKTGSTGNDVKSGNTADGGVAEENAAEKVKDDYSVSAAAKEDIAEGYPESVVAKEDTEEGYPGSAAAKEDPAEGYPDSTAAEADDSGDFEFEEDLTGEKTENGSADKTGIAEKIKNKYNKLVHYKNTATDPRVKGGIKYALKKAVQVLKHILPRKLKGEVHYGFDDPATTGYVTAVLGAMYGKLGSMARFEPDFENSVLEGQAEFRGRIILGAIAFRALQVIMNKDCRYVYKLIRS